MASDAVKNRNVAKTLNKLERQTWNDAAPYPGGGVPRIAVACFDPSANTGERTVAAHALSTFVPKGAFVLKAWYEVITTFTSANDTATIAISVNAGNDIVSAIAINNGGNPWDDGVHAFTSLTSPLLTTDHRAITCTVAVEALTAGKAFIYVEYVMAAA